MGTRYYAGEVTRDGSPLALVNSCTRCVSWEGGRKRTCLIAEFCTAILLCMYIHLEIVIKLVINPRRACTARVTVLSLSVCL